jgi:xylan 1,4-beta-xylosidase
MKDFSMSYAYEHIEHQDNLPLKTFFHSVKKCDYHWHKELELLLVFQGTVLVQVEGQEFLLKKGDLALINCGEIHFTHEAGDQNLLLVIQVDPSLAEKYDADIAHRNFEFNPIALNCRDDPRVRAVRKIMAQTTWEMNVKAPGFQLQVESLLHKLFAILLREFPHTLKAPRAEEKFRQDVAAFFPRLKRIVHFVESAFPDKIHLSEIANQEHISLSYLSRFFKAQTGCTFGEFVNLVRLRKSLTGLQETDHTISQVALDYGFPSVKAYNIIFKRTYHTTPTAWRKAIREQHNPPITRPERISGAGDPHSPLTLLQPYLSESA